MVNFAFEISCNLTMNTGLHYNLDLPEEMSTILEQDFWMLENIGPAMISSVTGPVKFAATTWIFVFKGICKADINLVTYEVKAPALVCVRSMQIMQPDSFSPDFNASIIVTSKRFSENLFMFLSNSPIATLANRNPVVPIPESLVDNFREFLKTTRSILSDSSNPYASQALLYQMLYFINRYGYKCYEPYSEVAMYPHDRISNRFLSLVQEHFRRERFLDFYASKLEITPKHLSRTVKKQTGYTAVEWIERFVILESKVLLKSSNLNIQQIADELNFPSQSFFGKYFKKFTGMSPKEFRNS